MEKSFLHNTNSADNKLRRQQQAAQPAHTSQRILVGQRMASCTSATTEETLNIEYHVKRKVLKALNKFPTVEKASHALGLTARTLYRYKHQWSIHQCPVTKEFSFQ